MIDQKRLEKYAQLAIVKGVNLQKDQTLMINASIDAVDMARACVKAAYAPVSYTHLDVVLWNNGDKKALKEQIHDILNKE